MKASTNFYVHSVVCTCTHVVGQLIKHFSYFANFFQNYDCEHFTPEALYNIENDKSDGFTHINIYRPIFQIIDSMD